MTMSRPEIEAWATAYIEAYSTERSPADDHPLWWAIEKAMFVLQEADAESFWQFILEVVSRNPPEAVVGMLAAGPLEELIAYAGESFVDRIETEAQHSPAFRYVLNGVWRLGDKPSDEIWARVERARGSVCEPGV
jgi:hypothetical protein